jgi:hypothetical protein
MPPMYGWLVKEHRGQRLSISVSSVEPWLNALSYLVPEPGQACYALPAALHPAPEALGGAEDSVTIYPVTPTREKENEHENLCWKSTP